MNDRDGDTGAATFTASRDGACDDVPPLRRIGQGDEDAMAAFYREHGRVVLAQVLLVVGDRVQAGVAIAAVGHAGPHRTLSAIGVLQQPPGSQFKVQLHVSARGCSPGSLADALNAALVSGG
jgi:hypothetical protein